MKKLFGITIAAVMAAAFLFGGSTLIADAADSKPGAERIVIAGTDRIIKNDSVETIEVAAEKGSSPTDTTAFLVGEFMVQDGSKARFNGNGDITLIGTDGSTRSGSYNMMEYDAQQAVVTIEVDSGVSRYSFDLTSGNGDFTLTDRNGATVSFVPVQYN